MTCPSEFALDEVLTHGAAPPITTHVDGCPRCQQRIVGRRADAREFAPYAPEIWRQVEKVEQVERVEVAGAARRRRWLPALVAAPAALAAAFGILLLVRAPGPDQPHAPSVGKPYVGTPYVGSKGGFALAVAAQRGDELFMADATHPVRAGDELRFIPSGAAPDQFIAIVSLDGRRELTLFYPARPEADSLPLPPADQALPGGIILDDAPGPERLFVVLSARPLRGAEVQAAVRAQVEQGAAAEAALARARARVIEIAVAKVP